jgi:hypothetical protein
MNLGKTPLARPRHIWEDNFKIDEEVVRFILTRDMEN